jgi:hypothetical protein
MYSYLHYSNVEDEIHYNATSIHRYLLNVPINTMTKEDCLIHTKLNPHFIAYFPPEVRSLEACLIAVLHDPDLRDWVPEEVKTPEFYCRLIHKNPFLIDIVPEKMLDKLETCLKVVSKSHRFILAEFYCKKHPKAREHFRELNTKIDY